mgnify:FL=1
MTELEMGIQGMVVMTVELENIFTCVFDGRVPPSWLKVRTRSSERFKIIEICDVVEICVAYLDFVFVYYLDGEGCNIGIICNFSMLYKLLNIGTWKYMHFICIKGIYKFCL